MTKLHIKMGIQIKCFFFFPQKHMLWVLIRSTSQHMFLWRNKKTVWSYEYGMICCKTSGDYKAAAKYYKKVLELDQKHSDAMVHAAFAYNQLGNTNLAENLLKQ